MNRLAFDMPPFKSIAWVGDEAEKNWGFTFRKINTASLATILKGFSSGKWIYRNLRIQGWQYLYLLAKTEAHDTIMEATQVGDGKIKGPLFFDVSLRHKDADPNIGQRQGNLPECCQKNYNLSEHQNRKEFLWETAQSTDGVELTSNIIEINSPVVIGAFWQQLLINLTGNTLCSLKCKTSRNLQQRHIDYMELLGYKMEALWLRQIYSWPLEWSASHGICELRTPIVKLAYDTDATAETYRIRVHGDSYPKEGLPGLNFPYRRKKFLKISDSKSFKAGLAHGVK